METEVSYACENMVSLPEFPMVVVNAEEVFNMLFTLGEGSAVFSERPYLSFER